MEAKAFVSFDGIQRAPSRGNIEGDLGGVNFEGEVDVTSSKTSKMGMNLRAKSSKPFCRKAWLVGGKA